MNKVNVLSKVETLQRKEEIISAIKLGKIFIYPTDTIYGLGCDATNEESVKKINKIKKREGKYLSVIAPNKKWIEDNFFVSDLSKVDSLPGPYTFFIKMKKGSLVAKGVTLDETLGVRFPNNWFTEIISDAGVPFITTSVNLSGEKHMEKIEDLPESINSQVEYIIYDGPIYGKSSTKIDLTK